MEFPGTARRRLLIEISAALFLSAVYFWLVKNYAIGIPRNTTNAEVFTSCSLSNFQLNQLYDVWKGRLSGLLLTGWLFDRLVNNAPGSYEGFCAVSGLYQGVWLFLLMLTVIFSLRHSLIINLGIFLGVMYNFFPVCGLYFYPWDIPATLFFTLAVLFYQQRKPYWMVAAICAGCFFKETVLVCALLALFVRAWKWWHRATVFAAIVTVYLLGKKLLLGQIHVQAAALSMNGSKNLGDVVKTHVLTDNLHTLFSGNCPYVIFANAGTMAAVLLFGWQKRFLPCMILILAFLAGQSMYGAFLEFRIFMQILPLSLIILCERFRPVSDESSSQKPSPGWAFRDLIRVLPYLTVLLISLSTLLIAWQYGMILKKKPTYVNESSPVQDAGAIQNLLIASAWFNNGRVDLGKKITGHLNNPQEADQLNTVWGWFLSGQSDKENKLAMTYESLGRDAEAIRHFQITMALCKATKTNSITANNFAWLLATSSDPGLRNGNEAVPLAEFACQTTGFQISPFIGTLAAAYAEAGRFNDAVTAIQQAKIMAEQRGQKDMAEKQEKMLEAFQSGNAYHEEPKNGQPPGAQNKLTR